MTNTVSSVNLRPDQRNIGEGNRGDELGLGKCCVKIFRLTGEGTGEQDGTLSLASIFVNLHQSRPDQ